MKSLKKLPFLFYWALTAAVLILVASTMLSTVQNVALNSEALSDFNKGWNASVNSQNLGTIDLPATVPAKKNDVVTITNRIPENLEQNSTLFFRTSQSFVKVFVGDTLLYSFGYEDDLAFGSVAGSAWQVIRIPTKSFGEQVTIEIVSPYSKFTGNVQGVYIGTKASILFNIIEQSMFRLVLCFLIFIAGIVLFALHFFAGKNLQSKGWLYLGMFSILLAVWSLGESRLLQLFYGNTYFVTNLVMLSLMVLPIPFFFFIDSFNCFAEDKIIKSAPILFTVNLVVCSVLQLANIADYFIMLTSTHVLIVLYVFYAIVKFVLYYRKNYSQDGYVLAFATTLMLLSSVLDVITYYRFSSTVDSVFSRVGFLLFIIIVGVWMGQQAILLHSQRIERETLCTLAYTDILTKIGNRSAFEEFMDAYRNGAQAGSAYVLMFDLNDLKLVNDTRGHNAGDKMIIRAADLIRKAFSDIGKCFRIGGDEFCVICPNITDALLAKRLAAFHQYLHDDNVGQDILLTIAHGFACYSPNSAQSIDSVLVEADRFMYSCKEKMKAACL